MSASTRDRHSRAGGNDGGIDFPDGMTSPDPILLHKTLQQLHARGVTHVALEASSHGLHQHRVESVKFEAAAFTNLTHDHLDYHGTFDEYFSAKARLFTELQLRSNQVWINVDDAYGKQLAQTCRERGREVKTFGYAGNDFHLRQVKPNSNGLFISCLIQGKAHELTIPVYGAFQAHNLCAAMGLAFSGGMDVATAAAHAQKLSGVRGRMEFVTRSKMGAPVFVDYAHTPDALETVLKSVREHTDGTLHVVFGCGGDRDAAKRPIMGEIAAKYADTVIVTDDNPRSENPALIRAAIMAASPGSTEIGDRREAIVAATQQLQPNDALVVCGKGHETYQIVGSQRYHFDDAEVIREAITL